MSVHIGELHSDVSAAGGSSWAGEQPDGDATEGLEERLRQAAKRVQRRCERVAAEGFDD